MCIRDRNIETIDKAISEHEINTSNELITIRNKIKEINDSNILANSDIYNKCTLIEGSLSCVKDELRGEINKKLTGVTERVLITRDLHNEVELEASCCENSAVHPMRFLNQARDCLLYTSRCV